MRILFCNPKNYQGATHSRKGMYAPLGILSVATVLKQNLADQVHIEVMDEDVEVIDVNKFQNFDLIGFYSTTFNYRTCVEYAKVAKSLGKITLFGGPHPTALAANIMRNQSCVDYLIKLEAERPFLKLVECLIKKDLSELGNISNLLFRDGDKIITNRRYYEALLEEIPFPSREYVPMDLYYKNYQNLYTDRKHVRPASIYSSKGCQWRDKTEGCVFCARLEEGVRFRPIDQIWEEIRYLKEEFNSNLIWDIADDNLADKNWIVTLLDRRPSDLEDMEFFIYSRVGFIKQDLMPYLKELNVGEVFLGVESGDREVLRKSFKGQTPASAYRAVSILNEHGIKYFPSFILGLPGESEKSMNNTMVMCQKMDELGGLDRIGCTVLMPIPASPAFDRILNTTELSETLKYQDDVDLAFLERYWIENFTNSDYDTVLAYKKQIGEIMTNAKVFGDRVPEDQDLSYATAINA